MTGRKRLTQGEGKRDGKREKNRESERDRVRERLRGRERKREGEKERIGYMVIKYIECDENILQLY